MIRSHSTARVNVLLALAAMISPSALAQAPKTDPIKVPTVEQLAQYPRMSGFRLSPDGKHMVAIESRDDSRHILVWKSEDLSSKPTVISAINMRIQSVSFVKNDVLAVMMTQPYDLRVDGVLVKTFINKLLITDLEGKTWKEPLESGDIARSDSDRVARSLSLPSIKSRLPKDPDHVIVESDGVGKSRDLFRYNVRNGAAARVLRLGENDINVVVDGAGNPRAKTRAGNDSRGLFIATDIRSKGSNEWEEHFRSYVKDRDVVEIVGPGESENTMVVRSNIGRERAVLLNYDIQQRKLSDTLFEHDFFEVTGYRRMGEEKSDDKGSFDGFSYYGLHGNEVHWVNPRFEATVSGLAQALGLGQTLQTLIDPANGKRKEIRALDGVSVAITGFRDGPTPIYLVRVSGLAYPTEHFILRGQKLSLLAREYPDIDRRALGSSRFVYYQARDGLQIPAYLSVPNPQLCGPGPYAAVVHPHGGPWARDDMDYDSSGWVPLMVSRCQVVLQPQFRGSAGWGRKLWMAGDAEWGQKMQDDKDDGALWLITQKLADPERVAMFGFSYGGYAAFAAAVRPNGIYKCAIAGAGVSDIKKIWAPFYTNPYYRDRQEPTVRGMSPAELADKIGIPILVYHGDRDQTVPLIQSELFVDKAKTSGLRVDYHMLKDYAHGPAWTRSTIATQLRLIEDYFSKGCGGSGL